MASYDLVIYHNRLISVTLTCREKKLNANRLCVYKKNTHERFLLFSLHIFILSWLWGADWKTYLAALCTHGQLPCMSVSGNTLYAAYTIIKLFTGPWLVVGL